ncbi:MAG TPA: glucokinase [Rhizomicrobium sp.]|nr:glucokinase [Rhizomicrobium sp.]
MTNSLVLVGDVGGTHARFAVADLSKRPVPFHNRKDLADASFTSFADAVEAYFSQVHVPERPKIAAIAAAGPVIDGAVTLTNRNWRLSEDDLRGAGFERALLINDFAALAFSATALTPSDLRTIGPDLAGNADAPITILGPGTGFGVSCLARYRAHAVPMATEGGHIGFSPVTPEEQDVLRILQRKFGHASVERILSGPGLENLYAALGEIAGVKQLDQIEAPEIQARAEHGDPLAKSTLEMFCAIFGSVAGDLALAHGAGGGVFIGGGIAAKIERFLQSGKFRQRFEDKGRLSYFVKTIPTRLILNKDAAFLGAALASQAFGAKD